MKIPMRRLLWPAAVLAGVIALLVGNNLSYIDAENILRDSIWLPIGAVLLVIGVVLAIFDAVKTMLKK